MAGNLAQMQWVTSGYSGSPGYTSFYCSSIDPTALQPVLAAQRAFFSALATYIPAGVVYSPPSNYRIVDGATGDLADIVPVSTPVTAVTGSGSGNWAAPAGFSVNWLTATPATSRLVVGRTYIVPAANAAYQTDGTLVATALSAIQSAASTLVSASSPIFVVWRRPVSHAGGAVATILGARVNDRVSVLKSRRS